MHKFGFCDYKFRSMLFSGTLSMAIIYVMLLCDSLVAGYFLGEIGVAAINTIAPVTGIVAFLSNIISIGTGILYSRRMGAMQKQQANEIFGQGLIVCVLMAASSALLLALCGNVYFGMAGITGKIYELAFAYYRWTPVSVVLNIMTDYLRQMVYQDGDETCSNIANISQVVVNIFVSVLLTPRYGMEGIILGTITGYTVGLLAVSWHFFRKSNSLRFAWHLSGSDLLQTVRYSIVDAVIFFCWSVVDFVLIGHISLRYGETGLVTLAVAFNLIELAVVLDGVGLAVQPLLETYLGEENPVMIRHLMKRANVTALLEGLAVSALVIVFARQFCALFGVTEGAVMFQTVRAVRMMSLGMVFCSLVSLTTSYYMLIDHVGLSVVITVLKDGVFYSLLPIVGSALFGIDGVWAALAAAPLLALVSAFAFVRLFYGKTRFPYLLEDGSAEILVMNETLTNDHISRLSERVSDVLLKRGYSHGVAMKAALFTEEICLTILEKNGKHSKTIYVEISLFLERSSVLMIERDSGVIFDITDPDRKIEGLSGFILSGLMEAHSEKAYLTTTGYNRNIIRFQDAH